MSIISLSSNKEYLKNRLIKLMLFRVIIVTLLLGTIIVIQIKKGQTFFIAPNNFLFYLIGITYITNICYASLIKRVKRLHLLGFIQILGDVFFVTALVYATGGIESFFNFGYFLVIIGGSILLYKKGGIFFASLSSILYGLFLDLEYYQIIHPMYINPGPHIYSSYYVFYRIFIGIASFYIIAFLTNYLSEELRKKGEALKQKEIDYEKLYIFNKNIMESIESGLLVTDLSERITFINRAGEEILGLKREKIINKEFKKVFDNITANASLLLNSKQPRVELGFEIEDKKKIIGFSRSILKDNEGEKIGNIFIFKDLTYIKEMEQFMRLTEKMAGVGQMAAGIAHEIRNPLTSISGAVQLIKEEIPLNEDNKNLMNIIIKETDRLNSLLSDFLLFVQPAPQKMEKIDLSSLMLETLELFKNSGSLNQKIQVEFDAKKNLFIIGDQNQLKQVFWNLILNSVQSMEDGGKLSIKMYENKKNREINLNISDTGCGITKADKEKIFEPFYTSKKKGTGLGLSITHRIVQSHKGRIIVESEVGKGTTFNLFFPSAKE